jgi:hypothetical protein
VNLHDVSREQRDRAGRWSRTRSDVEDAAIPDNHISNGSGISNDNLQPPEIELKLPNFPKKLADLGLQLISAPQESYMSPNGKEFFPKPDKDWKDIVRKNAPYKDGIRDWLTMETMGVNKKRYVYIHGGDFDTDFEKFVTLAEKQFASPAVKLREAKKLQELTEARYPSSARNTAVVDTFGLPGFRKVPSQNALIDLLTKLLPESRYLQYTIADDVAKAVAESPPGSEEWVKPFKDRVKEYTRLALVQGNPGTAQEISARIIGNSLAWGQVYDEVVLENRQKLRDQYYGIIKTARSQYIASGAKTATEWLKQLTDDPQSRINLRSLMVYPDETHEAKELEFGLSRLPFAKAVQRKLSDRTVQIKKETGPVTDLSERTNYSSGVITSMGNDAADVMTHEYGHHIESVLGIIPALQQFVLDRATYQPMQLGKNYGENEKAYPDTFINKYVGKKYTNATEVVSMGMQALLVEPDLFKKTDPEHFFLTIGILQGKSLGIQGEITKSYNVVVEDKRSLVRSIGARIWNLFKAEDTPPPTAAAPATPEPAAPVEKKKASRPIPEGARWVTVHSDSEGGGHPILVMPAQGRKNVYHVIGGAGGKLNHMELHLKSPEEWAKNSKERAQKRKAEEKAHGVTPDSKAAIRDAKQEASKQYVHRVAEQMGWKDYSDKTADDFLAQANGNKTQAALLAHQYLNSYVSKANQAATELRGRLATDQHALAGANLRIDTSNDPYQADDTDLVSGDISQRLADSKKVGNELAADNYQQTLDAMTRGDTTAAKTYMTAANKAAGIRGLTLQDVLPSQNVAPPSGAVPIGKQAKQQVQGGGALAPDALAKRIADVSSNSQGGDEIAKYTGQLELDALNKALQASGGDPTHTDASKAASYYLQAEKYRALRDKFGGDVGKFETWKGMRERAMANAAGVAAIKNQGGFGAADVDPDVQDMKLAKDLLAAKVLYDERMKRLKQAQQQMDPQLIHSVVSEKDTLETDADWNQVYDDATKKAFEQIQQSKTTETAAQLDTAIDDPSAFLRGVGDGEPIDQQRLKRYIAFGQQSAAELVGDTIAGGELLPHTAYAAMGVKAASQLMAAYLATHRTPEEFNAIREGIGNYHTARDFDVANGALVAASAVVGAAKQFKIEEEANVDNLYEAAKYNKLRMEAVDHALATLGSAYGELNATAELTYALGNAKPGPQSLAIDGGGRDAGQMVNLAHALGLADEDYKLTDLVRRDDGGVKKPRGLELTETGVSKLFHEAPPQAMARRRVLTDIRAGKQDDINDDGTKSTDGWLPAHFARWPAALRNVAPAQPGDEATVEKQTLSDPKNALKAVGYALGKQPYATVAFKDLGSLQPDDFKLLQAYYGAHLGSKADAPAAKTSPAKKGDAPLVEHPSPDAAATDIFGNQLMAQHAVGAGDGNATKQWQDFVHRVGAQRAVSIVQDVIKGDFLSSFAPVYSSLSNQTLNTDSVPLVTGDHERIGVGKQVESQLGALVDKLAWRYPNGSGAGDYEVPGISMSGKYASQQRVIKSLEASGGIDGKEGGRLGGFLGTGCIRHDTPLYDPVRDETRTVHEWMVSGLPLHVEAYDASTGKVVAAESSRPFIKGYEMMYAVQLSNGKTIHCTAAHRFLTPEGWRRLDELSKGSRLVAVPSRDEPSSVLPVVRDVPASTKSETQSQLSACVLPKEASRRFVDFAPLTSHQLQRDVQVSTPSFLPPRCSGVALASSFALDWKVQADEAVPSIPAWRGVRGFLHASYVRRLLTSWAFSPKAYLSSGLRSSGRALGSRASYWKGLLCGGPLLRDTIPCQVSFPLRVGVHGRSRWNSPQDVQEGKSVRTHLYPVYAHPSKKGVGDRSELVLDYQQRYLVPCGMPISFCSLLRTLMLSQRLSIVEKLNPESSRGAVKVQTSLASQGTPVAIESIIPTSEECVYDIEVYFYHNYITSGVISHNSGKTNVSVGAFSNLLAHGKVRQALYAVPSAVQGQFGPAIAGVIDPESPLKWHVKPGESSAERMKAMSDPNTHIITVTHQGLRDDTVKALGTLWGVAPKDAAKQFMTMTRKQRKDAVKQAFTKAGWAQRLDFFSPDEGHVALNRKGKANALLANVMDAVSDNSKYYLPLTGTPTKNDPSEAYDWLTKLRPDEYPPEKMNEFLSRHQLLTNEVPRLNQTRTEDAADGSKSRNWTSNAAAEALQSELGTNFYASAAPIKIPVTTKSVNVDLKDEPDDPNAKGDGSLQGFMHAGMQKSAYARVGQLEQAVKTAALNKDWPSAAKAIRELSTADYRQKNGTTITKSAFRDTEVPGSPEESARAQKLTKAAGMMRDAAYNRVLHAMPDGNMKTKALMEILDTMGQQDAADDNQPQGAGGNGPDGKPIPKVKGKPVIIFTRSLDAVATLGDKLKAKGYSVATISGRDNSANKLSKKELFQPSGSNKPKVQVLVMSDAMSAGIDLPRAEAVIHYDTPDTSKAQPLDAKILTPSGWKFMGEIVVGDEVIAGDGTVTYVTGVFPQGIRDVYRVTMTDGSSTRTCGEHLWFTRTKNERGNGAKGKIRELQDIAQSLRQGLHTNHMIPLVGNVEFASQSVPLDPYFMGLLLGDGHFGNGTAHLSSADEEIIKSATDAAELVGAHVRHLGKYDYSFCGDGSHVGRYPKKLFSPVVDAIDTLGLKGKRSNSKFVPDCYLWNNASVRLAVLQGLLDTDAGVDRRTGAVTFTSVSTQLVEDVQFLVRSLGGVSNLQSTRKTTYLYKEEKRQGQDALQLSIILPLGIEPFRLERKRILAEQRKARSLYRGITSVELEGEMQVQCIAVEHESHLYVTDDFIVTHNTLEQRSARAIRLSTKHPVSVYNLVSNTPYESRRTDRVERKGAFGDVVQNAADTLDDSSLARSISDARSTQSRQVHESAKV